MRRQAEREKGRRGEIFLIAIKCVTQRSRGVEAEVQGEGRLWKKTIRNAL
jgi:hypothetical protein